MDLTPKAKAAKAKVNKQDTETTKLLHGKNTTEVRGSSKATHVVLVTTA